ncbi:sulfotransferase family protein [Salinibacter ruber]|uniref:sulfotransferase family protein n=1 Tax=Salinibacter ruber TaxID=146919 RepID=UPI0021691695|nr:sulfotransferase [Salinibacter ruber]MCS4119423.1 hypothetical protein [Salinibacter ruber]
MVLPNFFLCGAPKAGTTSVYHYLDAHPDVYMSEPKETWFFNGDRVGALEEYSEKYFAGYDGEYAVGEGTTGYMAFSEVPARIAQHIPDARLIFLLRNPIERAYSQYWYRLQRGKYRPNKSFSEVIRDPNDDALRVGVVELGMYYDHLVRYQSHFDRSEMLILLFDELVNERDKLVRNLYSFIGVEDSFVPKEMDAHNSTVYPKSQSAYQVADTLWKPVREAIPNQLTRVVKPLRSLGKRLVYGGGTQEKPEMNPEDREYLRDVYREPNRKLAEWLDKDLSHWQ